MIDAKLEAQAAAGRSARESTAATLHRQPTPGSIAAAEVNLGGISPEKVQAVEALMARAREADRAGDQSACEQELAEVQRVFFQLVAARPAGRSAPLDGNSTLAGIDSRTTKLGAELGVVDSMALCEEKLKGTFTESPWEALQTDGHLGHL
jgi:hypothetical protein